MKILDISDNFELDKLIFECNSSGVISGKINQKDNLYKILSVTARDSISDINSVRNKIQKWYENVVKAEEYLDSQINSVRNQSREFNKRVDEMVDIGKKLEQVNKEKNEKENQSSKNA